jgi:hypothetical protein
VPDADPTTNGRTGVKPSPSFVVTVTARFERAHAAAIGFEAALADALMAIPDVATVRVEFAPQPSVCRLDATGGTRGEVEAACRGMVEGVVDGLGADCHVGSVVALTTAEWEREAREPTR